MNNILSGKGIVFPSLFLLLCALFLIDYLWLGIAVIVFLFLLLIFEKNAIIITTILSLLVLVSDINQTIRLLTNISCFIMLFALFFKNYRLKVEIFPRIPIDLYKFLFLFYIAIILSTIFSAYPLDGLKQIIQVSIFFVLVYLFYSTISTIKDTINMLFAVFLSAVIISGSIVYEFIANNYNLSGLIAASQTRTVGILSNVNAPGGLVVSILPILFSLLFYSSNKYKVHTVLAIIILIPGIILSTSRSAFIAIIASILFILFFHYRRKFLLLFSSIILTLFSLYLIPEVHNAINFLFRIESGLSQRGYLWEISINMITDYPIFGIGPGAYSHIMLNYFPVMFDTFVGQELLWLRDVTSGTNNSHNFILFFFSDMGILGLLSSIILPYTFFHTAYKTIKKLSREKSVEYFIVIGIIAAGIGLFLRSIFEGIGILTYGWIKMDLPFWLLFSVLIFYNKLSVKNFRNET
jgi:O-antigen ligase